jgi:cellulose synthase/poly-beta-1,6-N-acetylglucosamine synthase-like glycosyltransferase
MLQAVLLTVYTIGTLFLALYSLTQLVLAVRFALLAALRRTPALPPASPAQWPVVVLQLPLYNEKYVVERLLNAVAQLDYPRDRLIVQVLDDSSDDTAEVVAALVAHHRADGLDIHHVRRPQRVGFKAGALAYGLTLVPDAEFAAILDADFVPAPDFIRRLVPYFGAPRVAFAQGRWEHLNGDENALTRAQALNIDSYYWVEQAARSAIGTVMSFNGTGGMWRIAAIHDAGGWQSDTLTEDFDLSYRAQLRGWRGVFAPDVVVPGELPPQIEAYKRQQSRWATGSSQVLFKLLWPVLASRMSVPRKTLALLHMAQYLPHPVMLVLLLIAPFLILTGAHKHLILAPLTLFTVVQPALHILTQSRLHPHDWPRRMLAFPIVMILGIGLLWSNTCAAYAAFRSWRQHRELEFVRTPKFAADQRGWAARSAYALRLASAQTWVELGLAAYAAGACVLAVRLHTASVPWLLTYCIGLGAVALWGLADQYRLRQPAHSSLSSNVRTT